MSTQIQDSPRQSLVSVRGNMRIYVAILVSLVVCAHSSAQVHERRPGASFKIDRTYDFIYRNCIVYMQKTGHTITVNNREAGEIASQIGALRRGKLKEMGYRVFISLVKDSPDLTSVYVVVQKYERLSPKWGGAGEGFQLRGLDKDETTKVATELQGFLRQSPGNGPSSPIPQAIPITFRGKPLGVCE
jgi:hypothetical protein